MELDLSSEIETLIREDAQRGPYSSVEDFVTCAVTMLHEQESWLTSHRAEIGAKIEAGWASLQRGELISEEESVARMAEFKRKWFAEQQRVA
jgi:Arc/MetJ-type ribon-helix-helix transcriptional regulator